MAVPVRLDLLAELGGLGLRLDGGARRGLDDRRLRLDGLARGLPDPVALIETAVQRLDDRAERLDLAIAARLGDARGRVAQAAAALKHPRERLADLTRQLDGVAARLRPALGRCLERSEERARQSADRLRHAPLGEALARRGVDLAALGRRLDLAAGRLPDLPAERLQRLGQLLDSLSPYKVLERGYALVEDEAGHPLTASAIAPGMPLTLRFHDASIAARAESGKLPTHAPSADLARPKPAKKPRPAETQDRQKTLF
jgi:exodeoxyribonuclease VII large subunit